MHPVSLALAKSIKHPSTPTMPTGRRDTHRRMNNSNRPDHNRSAELNLYSEQPQKHDSEEDRENLALVEEYGGGDVFAESVLQPTIGGSNIANPVHIQSLQLQVAHDRRALQANTEGRPTYDIPGSDTCEFDPDALESKTKR